MLTVIQTLFTAFGILFVVNFAVFGAAAFLLTRRSEDKGIAGHLLVLVLGMVALGACAGFSGGMSRESAVGAVMPALFGLFGGVALYLFGLDRTRGAVASLMAACLSVSLFTSYAVSAQFRNYGDELRDLRGHCIKAYTDGDIVGNAEALAAFEARFLPYCASALDWNLDAAHRQRMAPAPPAK